MTTSRRSGNSINGAFGVQSIPGGSRKMVQSLKEIVNCPEVEIYAVLKECNMDPNEAVSRLLSQDTFHEVKSKRDKRKESKDTTESRLHGTNNTSVRGPRSGGDRYVGRVESVPSAPHGKSAYKNENLSNHTVYTSSAPKGPLSEDVIIGSKGSMTGRLNGNASSGYQPTWSGVPGQLTMADIVKMGRPHSERSNTLNASYRNANHYHTEEPPSHHNLPLPEDHSFKISEIDPRQGISASQNVSAYDEWPAIEQSSAASIPSASAASMPSVSEPPPDSLLQRNSPSSNFGRIDRHFGTDEVQDSMDSKLENHNASNVASVSTSKEQELNSGASSLYDNDFYQSTAEDVNVSVTSVTTNLQQLNVTEKDLEMPAERDVPSVVIPDHLQVETAACSCLSFGSFNSGPVQPSASVKSNLEEAPMNENTSQVLDSETRITEYYGDESVRNASDVHLFHETDANVESYDSSIASQSEVSKPENPAVAHGSEYAFGPSNPASSYESDEQLNAAFSQSQMSSQIQNFAQFSNVMAYTNSLPSSLLPANAQPSRGSDPPYSAFPPPHPGTAKYGNSVSSIGGSTISMLEASKSVGQHPQQNLSGTSVATGPVLSQQLALHPYSQAALSLGPYANMMGYPFLPQSYTYMPSAFQQAFAGNNTYHQSLATVQPQYKNSISESSMPQSAAAAAGHGAFGGTNTIPGNFSANAPAAPSGTTLSYEDLLNLQYKDNNHLISLQQSENSGTWLHGHGSRTLSSVPGSTYYSLQGQSQQAGGLRQLQQPSQNYGYPNLYQALDHQQQNSRDGSQGQPKPSLQHQLWQNY